MRGILIRLVRIKNYILRRIFLQRIQFQSHLRSIRAKFIPDQILIDKPYAGQKILLIALYEKTVLRPDIERLLKIAKGLGYFIVGCNTEKLVHPEYFDLYIERFNFGRDFGSYQSAFFEIFKKQYHLSCPRLLMLNDSVFFESSRTPKFLEDLMNTETDVLGASENFHLQHHLGSFCISYSSKILKHPAFIRFWENYSNSDVRPLVIDRGEKALTACLKSIIPHSDSFGALYDVNRISDLISSCDESLDLGFQLTCSSGVVARLSAKECWKNFVNQYYFLDSIPGDQPIHLHKVGDFVAYLKNTVGITDPQLEAKAKTFIRSKLCHAFSNNSQIHTNAVFLMHLGFPLVKLDGYFRGAFTAENVLELCQMMSPIEGNELRKILFSRPFGSDVLPFKERMLFECGFI